MMEHSQAATSRLIANVTSTSVPSTSCSSPPATWMVSTRYAILHRGGTAADVRSSRNVARKRPIAARLAPLTVRDTPSDETFVSRGLVRM